MYYYHGVAMVVMKNCDPFVLGPALAIDNNPKKNEINFHLIYK
jgi:hypothetical protein